jgi:hypothetical protein
MGLWPGDNFIAAHREQFQTGSEHVAKDKADDKKTEEVAKDAGEAATATEAPAAAVAPAGVAAPAADAGQQVQQTLIVDDSGVVAGYANFCRVSSTPEELIMDLGLNPNPYAQGEVTVPVGQRIIMNHFTAKRLLSALSMALQRHEQAFGVLETDVRRRVRRQ